MAGRSLPTVRSLWARHEELLLRVFAKALQSLRSCGDLPDKENDISKHLAVETRKASFLMGLDYPPQHELPRQPASESDLGGPGAGKRPDFTSTIRDPSASNATTGWLAYHIECKCLGEPRSRSWIFNENYVRRGIHRFLDPEYSYGAEALSGAMIGYILSMGFEDILEEVNGYLKAPSDFGSTPAIDSPESGFAHDKIAKTSQTLDRAFVAPRHFALRHLWVDLRSRI